MSEDERMAEARKIMEAFQRQTQMVQGGGASHPTPSDTSVGQFDNQGGNFGKPGDGNNIGMGFDNQGETNAGLQMPVRPKPVQAPQQTFYSTPSQGDVMSRPDICPQCKSMHPPLRPGEKCPNSGVGDAVKNTGIDDAVINKHLVDLRNIIMSQLTAKGIKDGRKFLQYSVIELTKALEEYNE